MEVFKKIRIIIFSIFLLGMVLMFSGCATLTYSGDDYNQENLQTVKTKEDLVFDVYKKTIDNANIKIGITRTPVPEILAIYVQVENLSYETPYVFKVENLRVYNPDSELPFIATNNYLNIYQTQEASSMASMSAMGANLQNMTGMNANYNDYNQTIAQNASEQSNKSAFSHIEEVGSQIAKHSIKYSATVSPRRSQYFYFFVQDYDKFPLKITYKDLVYQFKL